jgi:hypothetical protein
MRRGGGSLIAIQCLVERAGFDERRRAAPPPAGGPAAGGRWASAPRVAGSGR